LTLFVYQLEWSVNHKVSVSLRQSNNFSLYWTNLNTTIKSISWKTPYKRIDFHCWIIF